MTSVTPLRKTLGTQPPIKPILRPDPAVTLSAPKKRAMDDADEPESPSKRQKNVHFDDTPRTFHLTERSLEDTKREVRKALERFSKGEKEDYNDLKAIFANDAEASESNNQADLEDVLSSDDLIVYVIALSQCAHLLGRSCSALIKAILQCRWLGRTELFASAYTQLLAALISAQGACLEPVLTMLVEKFRDSSPRSWSVPNSTPVDKETVRRRLHSSLQYLLKLFPAARPLLCKLISQKFPFSEESERVHLAYVQNLIRLKDYTDLGADITEIITSRLVKLDVEFQLDLDDMDDDLVPQVIMHLQAAQEADQEADDSDAESDMSDEEDEDDTAQRIEKSALLVKKLDSMLDAMFDLYAPIFADPETEEAREYFANMFSDFTNFVLPTHKSRHTQFLIFHYSQQSPSLTDAFVGSLFDIAFESNRPAAIRQAAVAYLGSFVARGAHVSTDLVRNIMRVLCHHIEKFRIHNGANCRGASLQRYHTLYSWVQAAMYIFCFKYRDLIDDVPDLVDREDVSTYLGQEMEWMDGLKESMRSIIYSPFNPLKVCSPALVEEFAKIASHLRFLYLFPKIENNKKIHLSAFVSGAYSNGGALRDVGNDLTDEAWLQLEDNFPFDPYQLPVSKRWLEGDYNNWTPIPGLDEDDDADDDTQSQRQMTEDPDELEEEYEEDTTTDEELALPARAM